MEHLALELLEHISTLACTDGGRTGCALSLVSTHIRAASRTARFYSVALTSGSSAQLASFLACFIRTTNNTTVDPALGSSLGYTPRVRHLCLTLQTRTREQRTDKGTTLRCASIARTLFHAVAPTLYSLALIIRGELAGVDSLRQLGDVPFGFIVAKPMQRTDEQGEQGGKLNVVKHDWLARIEGGLGCWDVEALSWKS